jgi:hypothetical protein
MVGNMSSERHFRETAAIIFTCTLKFLLNIVNYAYEYSVSYRDRIFIFVAMYKLAV